MMLHIGKFADIDITLDMDIEMNQAIHGLISHQQDQLEALRFELSIEGTMQKLIDREDG